MPKTDEEITLDLIPMVLLLSRLLDRCPHLTSEQRQATLDCFIDTLVDDHREERQ